MSEITCPNCGFSGPENEFSSGFCPECDTDVAFDFDLTVQEPINYEYDEEDQIDWDFS